MAPKRSIVLHGLAAGSLLALAACAHSPFGGGSPEWPAGALPPAGATAAGPQAGPANAGPAGSATNGSLLGAAVTPGTPTAPDATPAVGPGAVPAAAEDNDPSEDAALVGDDLDEPEGSAGQAVAFAPTTAEARPFATWSDAEIDRRVAKDLGSLGPISVGWANQGGLVNAVQMPPGDGYRIIDPADTWGTQETIDALTRCIDGVRARFAGTPRLQIGQMSAEHGGRLSSHKSHQSGRDVDVGYYYLGGEQRGFIRASLSNLDVPRTWAFVRALFTESNPEFVFIDTSIQKLLKEYALAIGEDQGWIDHVFQFQSREPWPIIRYAPGHDNHIHVRFYNPRAQEMGVRAYDALVKHGKYHLPSVKSTKSTTETAYVTHIARSGETLDLLARRYATTVEAIQQANGLRSNHIKSKQQLRIPTKKTRVVTTVVAEKAKAPPRRVVIPAPRIPPRDPKPPAANAGATAGATNEAGR